MRLGVQLLDTSATLNRFKKLSTVTIGQGETVDLFFQLVDLEQDVLRYIPAVGATVLVEIPRLPESFGTSSNVRDVQDFSVRRNANVPFADDRSICKISLTANETANMMSSNIRVTLNESGAIKMAVLPMAIKVFRSEGQ